MQFLNALAVHAIPFVPRALVHRISRRYIAGDTLEQALVRVQQLNVQGFCATLDVLGESVLTQQQAETMAQSYAEVLDALHVQKLVANVSIKPSALGMLLDAQLCEGRMARLLHLADSYQNSICMDMEDVTCTQKELDLYRRLSSGGGNIGLALQAYLKRTYEDIGPLVQGGRTLRICKGIYVEDPVHLVAGAPHDRRAINTHFLRHVAHCFAHGSFVGIATHDEALIEEIVALVNHLQIDPSKFEFQMLLGVCEPLRDKLRDMGFAVRVYVPFGKDWYGYSTRRLKENPSIAGYVLKALIGL